MGTNKISFGTGTELPAVGTYFGSQIRIDSNHTYPSSQSFVLNKVLQLEETPSIQPKVEPLAFFCFSYSFEVFHNNSPCVAVINNLFADNMIPVSLETSLSARNLFEKLLGGTSAFALEPCSQSLEFEAVSFNLLTAKKLPVACHGNMIYSDINTNLKSVRNLADVDISGKSDVDKHPAFFVEDDFSSLAVPIQILPVVFWNCDWNFDSAFGCCELNFIEAESECPLVEVKRHNFFEDGFAPLIGFNAFKRLGSNTIGIYNKLRGQVEFASCFMVAKMMKLVPVLDVSFEAFVGNVRNRFGVFFHHAKKSFVEIYSDFDGSSRLHKNKVSHQIYKSYSGRCPVKQGGWQFLPCLKTGVSLPTSL